jgi:poly(3-hydroxybutyrate) depolymerase
MRLIHQGARELYVPTRRSEPAVIDNLQWPTLTFAVKHPKRIERRPLPKCIPEIFAFDDAGVAPGKLHLINGRGAVQTEETQVAITSVNELFAEVVCLTHDWGYAISLDAISRETLPGLLTHVDGYDTKAIRRLELVRMLFKANRLPEASALLRTIAVDFPDFAAEQAEYQLSIREQLARQITAVLEQRRDVGQHQLASKAARLHPKNDLTPETVVRVGQLIRYYDDLRQRIQRVQSSLHALVADVRDPVLQNSATLINRLVSSQIDEDTIDRFATFELIAPPMAPADQIAADGALKPVAEAAIGNEAPTSEELLAMAFSGWLMGAENSIRSLSDTVSLFEARQMIVDYLDTAESEIERRRTLANQLTKLEGVGIARVAAIVRNLSAVHPIRMETPGVGSVGRFQIDSTAEMAGAVGIVPPEYHETRRYPVVIAFGSQYGDASSTLNFWQAQAEKYGYIIVVPEWHRDQASEKSTVVEYDASADTHIQFLNLVRRLKRGLSIDDDRIFAAGHGMGGEAAMDMVSSHPDLFAGVVSICGMGRRHLQWTAQNAIHLPWYVVVGDAQGDWFDRMGMLAAKLFKRDAESETYFDTLFVKYPYRGVEWYPEEADNVFAWMALHKRNPLPEKIYARLLRSSDLHWSWLRLKSLPPQFAQLDAPGLATDVGFRPAELKVRCNDKNYIIIDAAPAGMTLFLSPDLPNLDLNKPITVKNGRKDTVVDYRPEISHLLEEFYYSSDHRRLCYMRVESEK